MGGGVERLSLHDVCPPWTLMGGKGGRGGGGWAAGVAHRGWAGGMRPLPPAVAEGLVGAAPSLRAAEAAVAACRQGNLAAERGRARRGVQRPRSPLLLLPPKA